MSSGRAGFDRAAAFGLHWQSDVPLPFFPADPGYGGPADIRVQMAQGVAPERSHPVDFGNVTLLDNGFRYKAADDATIEVYGHDRVDLHPGPAWSGVPPASLASTVSALILARRGCLPMHGSAVACDGEATLICGPSGTGKSTYAARLIARGALLISDDLSVLHPDPAGGPPMLYAGRRSMRLYPGAAEALGEAVEWRHPPHPADGKLAVYPPQVGPVTAIPLTRVILLGQPEGVVAESERAPLLATQFFRPRCLQLMRGHVQRLAMLILAARHLNIRGEAGL